MYALTLDYLFLHFADSLKMVDTRPANDCYFTDDEVAACVDEGAYIIPSFGNRH